MTMVLEAPQIAEEHGGGRRVSVMIGDFPLWYRVPAGLPLAPGGEFLAAAALLPAMMRGTTLVLPDACPIDERFRGNLDRLQDTFLGWQSSLACCLSRVEVVARTREDAIQAAPGAMTFFSGGVDGCYTALRHRHRITRAIMLRGIDMQLENDSLWQEAHAAALRIADHWGLPLVAIETNVRFLGYHYGLRWSRHYQGAGLASIAHLIPHAEALVAASHDIAILEPNGSHVLTDPLWSSDATRIVHDGAVCRTVKLEALADDPDVLAVLRVCWHDQGFNCGACEKCLRTMVTLRLLGAPMPSFPANVDLSRLDALRVDRGGRADYLEELLVLERAHPDPVIRQALQRAQRAGVLRDVARIVDGLLGGHLLRLKRSRQRPAT